MGCGVGRVGDGFLNDWHNASFFYNVCPVNPIAASLLAAVLVNEPVGLNLLAGMGAVALGIWIASGNRE